MSESGSSTRPKSGAEKRKVALLVGGGVSAEILPHVLEVIDASGVSFDWQRVDVPAATREAADDYLDEVIAAVHEHKVALKTKFLGPGPLLQRHSDLQGPRNPNVELRQRLDLYAGVRPIKTFPGIETRYPDLDLLLVRENTEDIYIGIEHEIVEGVVESLKVVTREACHRIATYCFGIAKEHDRKQVTFIHKGNIMKRSDGLFINTVRAVAEKHPEIAYKEMIVDAACMQMVLNPYQFDVLLTGNLYGDVLSSLGTGLAGGISVAHGINLGDECRVFEAIHGEATHLMGTGTANPLPLIQPAIAMLRHFEEYQASDRIEAGIRAALGDVEARTPDLGGSASAEEMCRAIVAGMSG